MSTLLTAHLQAPADQLADIDDFYASVLEFPAANAGYRIGISELAFAASAGRPFYHYALLVPCNRFDAAHAWAAERTKLLPVDDSGQTVIHFDFWDADALYFHDPAGNIVELIAHAGVGTSQAQDDFSASELLQLSEVGLVGDKLALVEAICSLGHRIADGDPADPHDLVFIGPPTCSIIVSPTGRGWLPLHRPAEHHPVDLTVAGLTNSEVITNGHRIRQDANRSCDAPPCRCP